MPTNEQLQSFLSEILRLSGVEIQDVQMTPENAVIIKVVSINATENGNESKCFNFLSEQQPYSKTPMNRLKSLV